MQNGGEIQILFLFELVNPHIHDFMCLILLQQNQNILLVVRKKTSNFG